MTSIAEKASAAVGEERAAKLEKIWGEKPSLHSFFATVDHKRVGHRYMITAGIFFILSGINALAMRTQLARPGERLLSPETYNQLFTVHGTTMIFFFATPMFFGFGNYLVPIMIGARDMAFPRLNMFGYWIFVLSGIVMFASEALGRAPNGGWFNYVPLTSRTFDPGYNITFYTIGLLFLGTSTTVGAINFIVTVLKLRAPGMSLNRVPIFVWAIVATSFMVLFALPSLNLANAMLYSDREFHTHFFDPGKGGNVLLWQHLFWIFGHPDVYIIVMPALGIVSSVLPAFCRRGVAAYSLVVLSIVATSIVSFGVWVHHMFATGLPQLSLMFFSAASTLIVIPSGIQMFAWLATMLHGRIIPKVPFMYVAGFIVTFVIGGVTGAMFAIVSFDQQITDSYFVVAHFHYVLFGGAVFPMLAGVYYWLPKFTGKMFSAALGKWSFWLVFLGTNLTFFPMHLAGLAGMPRRNYTYEPGLGWGAYQLAATVGAYVLLVGLLLVLVDVLRTIFGGAPVGGDPWGGDTLEWATTSPPKPYNFVVMPRVRSLHPVWDEQTRRSMVEEAGAGPDRVLADGRKALLTSELDARYETPIKMAESTLIPLVTALAILVGVVGLLVGWWWLAGLGAVATATCAAAWLWRPISAPLEAKAGES